MRPIPTEAYFFMVAMFCIICTLAYFRYRREIKKVPVRREFWWKVFLASAYFSMLACLSFMSKP